MFHFISPMARPTLINDQSFKVASHRIRLRLTIRLMANGSLHTCSVGRIRVNFLGFERFKIGSSRTAVVVGDGVLAARVKTAVRKP